MRMIDLASQTGPLHIIDTPTAVDCGRDVRYRRSLRSLVECVVPCCGFPPSSSDSLSDTESTHCSSSSSSSSSASSSSSSSSSYSSSTTTVTGTFFGHRRGRVSFCIQDDCRSTSPLLLLEFAVPTSFLAREMQHGLLRIALESDRRRKQQQQRSPRGGGGGDDALFSEPVWSMYCNGRKAGYAVRRRATARDVAVLKLMRSVSVGAGVLPIVAGGGDGDLMYLRASFERVIGSVDSESFHMINPAGSDGQELSIFLVRS